MQKKEYQYIIIKVPARSEKKLNIRHPNQYSFYIIYRHIITKKEDKIKIKIRKIATIYKQLFNLSLCKSSG